MNVLYFCRNKTKVFLVNQINVEKKFSHKVKMNTRNHLNDYTNYLDTYFHFLFLQISFKPQISLIDWLIRSLKLHSKKVRC